MNVKRKVGAAIGVVALGVVMTGFVPVAAGATQNEGITIPEEFCTADIPGKDAVPGVPAKTEYEWSKDSPGEGWVKTGDHKWVITVEGVPAVPGFWTNFQPNDNQGPFEGPPTYPTDERGTWSEPKENGGPDKDKSGVYQNGNGSWFYREQGTPAVKEVKHKEYKWKFYTPAIPGEDAVPPVPGVCDVWVTWMTPTWAPDANDANDVGWPQTFVQFGQGQPTECEVTYQIDRYQGSRSDIEDVVGDGTLTGYPPAEDADIVTDWYFASSDECLGVAAASWEGTVPTCLDLDGSGEFAFENATVTSAYRAGDDVNYAGGFTPGTHNSPYSGDWTVTLTANEGFEFPGGNPTKVLEFTIPAWLTAQDCLIEVVPDRPEWVDPCGVDNGYWILPETEGVTYTTFVKKNGAIQVTATPMEGYEFPEGAKVQWTKKDSGELCPVLIPIPAQFNADPAPASCVAPGSFDDGALGGEWVGGDEEWRTYAFEGFWLDVYVGTPGQVTLYLDADYPNSFDGLNENWWVSEDGTYAERTIHLAVQLSGPEACPQDIPAPLTGEDVTEVGACVVPLDGTATVTTTTTAWSQEYVWDDETGEYILGEKVYAEPVETVVVEDADQCDPTDTPPVKTPPTLSETGFEGMGGVYGSAALILAGGAMLVTRRLMGR